MCAPRCTLCVVLVVVALAVEARTRSTPEGTLEDYLEGFVIGSEDVLEEKFLNPPVDCRLPSVRGNCRALMIRWKYDATLKYCREFKYGGCGGNANNFLTRKQCMRACKGV